MALISLALSGFFVRGLGISSLTRVCASISVLLLVSSLGAAASTEWPFTASGFAAVARPRTTCQGVVESRNPHGHHSRRDAVRPDRSGLGPPRREGRGPGGVLRQEGRRRLGPTAH